jgi:hypothetical protein
MCVITVLRPCAEWSVPASALEAAAAQPATGSNELATVNPAAAEAEVVEAEAPSADPIDPPMAAEGSNDVSMEIPAADAVVVEEAPSVDPNHHPSAAVADGVNAHDGESCAADSIACLPSAPVLTQHEPSTAAAQEAIAADSTAGAVDGSSRDSTSLALGPARRVASATVAKSFDPLDMTLGRWSDLPNDPHVSSSVAAYDPSTGSWSDVPQGKHKPPASAVHSTEFALDSMIRQALTGRDDELLRRLVDARVPHPAQRVSF